MPNAPQFKNLKAPTSGEAISIQNGKLHVPDNPVIPFIEGDGTGPDIWRSSKAVFDAAVEKAYGGKRKIEWFEVYAGEKSFNQYKDWLPEDTFTALKHYLVSIKGPLTTPVGGGIRSLNVALRQMLDLYVCLRPVRWFKGRSFSRETSGKSRNDDFPRKHRRYLRGHRIRIGLRAAKKMIAFIHENFPKDFAKIRFPETSGIGIKPVSRDGTERLCVQRSSTRSSKSEVGDDRPQGQHHEVSPKARSANGLSRWRSVSSASKTYTWDQWEKTKKEKGEEAANAEQKAAVAAGKVIVKDAIADIALQQVLTRPDEFQVIATCNFNGDYLSDALAAQVGGIGIAPGGNMNYLTGHAVFEATHGTAPKYANLDKVNPGSVILSGEMMFRYMGWTEAADLIIKGMDGAIAAQERDL